MRAADRSLGSWYDISLGREMLTAAVGIRSRVERSCISRHQSSRQEFARAVSDIILLSQ